MAARVIGEGNVIAQYDASGGVTLFTINPDWLHHRTEIHRLAELASATGEEIVDVGGDRHLFYVQFRGERLEFREKPEGGLAVHFGATA